MDAPAPVLRRDGTPRAIKPGNALGQARMQSEIAELVYANRLHRLNALNRAVTKAEAALAEARQARTAARRRVSQAGSEQASAIAVGPSAGE